LTRLLLLTALVAVPTMACWGQPPAQPGNAPAPAEAPADREAPEPAPQGDSEAGLSARAIEERLAALDPAKPWGYLELGEDVAAQATTPQSRTLARTLFVLAYETARKAPPDPRGKTAGADIRVSVCLALATLSGDESEQRWLRAIASSLGWNGPQSAAASAGQPLAIDPAALDLASALGLIRIGEGRRAAKLLEKPEVSQLLDRTERLLSPAGLTGGASRIKRLMAEWPNCTECKNRRFVKTQDGVRLCPRCGGKPGPKLPQQELLYQLRLESSLLRGVQRSWVAQSVVDGGAPLRDLDPDELAATYRVEPSKTLWRNGVWVAPTSANPAAGAGGNAADNRR